MNFKKKAMELFTNKYFLYFMVVLSGLNMLGYLVMNNLNAVIFFALIAILVSNFSKNMSIILLISLLATNLLTAKRIIKEGMESNTNNTNNNNNKSKQNMETDDTMDNVDPSFKKGANALQTSNSVSEAKSKLESQSQSSNNSNTSNTDIITPPMDPNNMDMNMDSSTTDVEPNVSGMSNMKKNAKSNSGSRLDYASTLEEAYDNLDKMLGSDGIKQLTNDTKDLMIKQQELFKSMEGMAPLLNNAKSMLDGFDMKNLSGLANLAQSFTTNIPGIQIQQPKS